MQVIKGHKSSKQSNTPQRQVVQLKYVCQPKLLNKKLDSCSYFVTFKKDLKTQTMKLHDYNLSHDHETYSLSQVKNFMVNQ